MNKLRTLLTWGLLSAATYVMGYTITVNPVDIEAGQSTNLIINLNNTETSLTAYQMFIDLPKGVTVQKKANGKYKFTANADRHDGNFTISVQDEAAGRILVTCFSADKDVLTGTSGELIRLPIDVASTVTTSLQGCIEGVEFSDVNNQAHKISDVNFTMTMEGGETPPVITGEVTVSVPDVAITAGGSTDMIINMQTDLTSLTAYQMFIDLPNGVTVQKKANGKYKFTANADRHDGNFTISVQDEAAGRILVTCFSADKDVLTGTSGELIRLPIDVASTVTTSLQGCIEGVEFSDVNNQAHKISDVNFTITMEGGDTPPVITFADANVKALCVSNWDMNGDGELSEEEAAAVTDLGTVFKNNTQIKSFDELQYFTGITSVGDYAFYNCSGLTSVTIPNSVTVIGHSAFSGCSGLTSIEIPNSVTVIGERAFYDCYGLKSVTSEIQEPFAFGSSAFSRISSSCILTIPYGTQDAYIAAGWTTDVFKGGIADMETDTNITSGSCGTNVNYSLNTETGVLSITGTGAMTDYSNTGGAPWYEQRANIKSVEIADGVTSIGERTFRNCNAITSISISNSVKSINSYAFSNCSGLTSVTIPNGVTSIGLNAFDFNLTSIVVASGNAKFDSRDNCNAVIETATNTLIMTCQNTVIPNSVRCIGNYAFYRCPDFSSVTIPNSVTSIGDYAFYNCSSLTSVDMFSNIESIGTAAFKGTTWYDNQPDGMIYVGKVFYKYKGTMPENTSITIDEGTLGIAGSAFNGCSVLTSVTIPNSMTSIGGVAFEGCTGLTEVYCYAENVPSTSSDAFKDSYVNYATLYVPEASVAVYKAAEPWSGFGTIKTLSGEIPVTPKCATPTISYENGKLTFSCDTEGATCQYSITDTDIKAGSGNEVQLTTTYKVTVYATKDGYENSDVATKDINVSGGTSGIRGDVNNDGTVNMPDAMFIVNKILNGKFPDEN